MIICVITFVLFKQKYIDVLCYICIEYIDVLCYICIKYSDVSHFFCIEYSDVSCYIGYNNKIELYQNSNLCKFIRNSYKFHKYNLIKIISQVSE